MLDYIIKKPGKRIFTEGTDELYVYFYPHRTAQVCSGERVDRNLVHELEKHLADSVGIRDNHTVYVIRKKVLTGYSFVNAFFFTDSACWVTGDRNKVAVVQW